MDIIVNNKNDNKTQYVSNGVTYDSFWDAIWTDIWGKNARRRTKCSPNLMEAWKKAICWTIFYFHGNDYYGFYCQSEQELSEVAFIVGYEKGIFVEGETGSLNVSAGEYPSIVTKALEDWYKKAKAELKRTNNYRGFLNRPDSWEYKSDGNGSYHCVFSNYGTVEWLLMRVRMDLSALETLEADLEALHSARPYKYDREFRWDPNMPVADIVSGMTALLDGTGLNFYLEPMVDKNSETGRKSPLKDVIYSIHIYKDSAAHVTATAGTATGAATDTEADAEAISEGGITTLLWNDRAALNMNEHQLCVFSKYRKVRTYNF